MLEFNQALADALGNANTKAQWAATIINALGPTRRLVGLKNGTAFADVALVGAMATAGGNITSFGKTSDATVQMAADLATGTCLLRIEGGGNYIQGSLGLPGSGADFILPSNPTATSGIGFAATCVIRAPALMPTGTGPAAPPLDANTITAFRVMDWRDPANVVPWGTAQFNVRDPDFVLEHPWMASDIGDVRVQRVADGAGVVMGTGGDCYRFAGDNMIMNAVTNSEAPVPLQQVEIRARPHGRWASHPVKKDFSITADTLSPLAFKIELLRADGSIADVMEMYSTRVNNIPGTGKPINAADQNQNFELGPVKPWWTCQMTLQWWSHKPKMHSKAWHFCPGVEMDALAPNHTTEFATALDQWPVITGAYSANGLNTWRLAPKWSRGAGQGFDTTIIDTYHRQPARDNYITQAIGHGHEPGSTGTHVWYMAPGGPRADRSCWPTSIITYMSDPNGTRIHGAVPYKELFHDWMMGYFNHGCHYFTDLERGYGLPKSKILNGDYCFNDYYYVGSTENYRPDIENHAIRLLAATKLQNSGPLDKNGRRFTNEWARDLMHNQNNAAPGAYLYRSARHALEAVHSFRASMICTWDFNQNFHRDFYMRREHVWYNWNFANMWMCASSDPRSFSLNEIETAWGRHLEQVYDAVHPFYSAGTDTYSKMLRTLGIGFEVGIDGANTTYKVREDSKAFYAGQMFLLMKQSGSLDAMRARSPKCAGALDMWLDCITTYCAGPFADANGRGIDKYNYPPFSHPTAAPVDYTNWGVCWPPIGQQDWITGADGVIGSDMYGADGTNTQHFRAQTVKMLKTFGFSNTPKLDQAISNVNGWYGTVATVSTPTGSKFQNRYSMMGFFKQPDYVGPPV